MIMVKTIRTALIVLLASLSLGCATYMTDFAEGIEDGMSVSEVVNILRAQSHEIISVSDTEVVAVGWWDVTEDEAKKVFVFRDDKLISRRYDLM
jgi:hypothetical protein